MSDEQLKLSARADTVDLRLIGQISITKPKYISGKLMAQYCRVTATQALLDNINNSYSELLLRNTIPKFDLLDGYGADIQDKIWIQPQNNITYDQSDYTHYHIYRINRMVNNDRKVHLFYGVLNMRPDQPHATKLVFQSSSSRIREIIDLTTIAHYHNIVFFQQPLLLKRNDDTIIMVDLGPDARGHNDHLALLGITAEILGVHYGSI